MLGMSGSVESNEGGGVNECVGGSGRVGGGRKKETNCDKQC